MSRNVTEEIEKEVRENPVLVYMKGTKDFPQCGFSQRVVQTLRGAGIDFQEVNVLEDPEKWQAVKTFSDWPTIPQIYIGGEFVGGGDQLAELAQSGKLTEIVAKTQGRGRPTGSTERRLPAWDDTLPGSRT